MNNKGVTFIELMVVIGVLAIIFAMAVPSFIFFQKGSSLDNDAEEILNLLRLAQSKTLASEDSGQYGVYFQPPGQFILFKGADYSSRDTSYDKTYSTSAAVEIYDGSTEFVFDKITGFVDDPGYVSLRLISEPSDTKTIYVEGSGSSSLTIPSLPSGSKIGDSRHMHFEYTRLINTAAESITVTVEGGESEDIPIADFLSSGQFLWEGTVDGQVLKIQTQRLNNPDTELCVHRDRRYNDKGISISLSGDSSGNVAVYSADGSVLTESIYVSSAEEQ
jgi:prepilin-type N-terminal cleavage/methylation domain-containing protein